MTTRILPYDGLLKPAKTQGELMSYRQGYATGLACGRKQFREKKKVIFHLKNAADLLNELLSKTGRAESWPVFAGDAQRTVKAIREILEASK